MNPLYDDHRGRLLVLRQAALQPLRHTIVADILVERPRLIETLGR
jgi:hypothetical protein